MKLIHKFLLSAIAGLVTLSSCSDSSTNGEIFTPKTYTVSGKVEKGPFVSGSTITIQPMDNKLQVLGSMFNATITDNLGNFTFGSKEFQAPYAEMMATGYFFNEVRGELSEGTLVLRSLVDLSDNSTVNVNILTHLKYPRIKKLIESGKSFKEANKQAQEELLKAFGLQNYASKDASQFSIVAGTDESAALIAVSSLLLNGRSEGALTEYLSSLSQEFGNNGEFSESTKAQFKKDREELADRLDNIKSNILSRYSELGIDVNVKDLSAYFDWNDDGIAGNEVLKEGQSVTLDKTEIAVPKEGGTFTVSISSPIPVYTEPLSSNDNCYPSDPVYFSDLYAGDINSTPDIEKSIENNVLTIKVAASQSYKEQTSPVNIYDALGNVVATVNLTIAAGKPSDKPLLGNGAKDWLVGCAKKLANAFSTYNYLEQFYFNNKAYPKIPLRATDSYINNCWSDFFRANRYILYLKEIDADQLNVYQDYCNVFYAMYYYTMIVAWGDVPYNYGNTWTDVYNNIPRVSKDKILTDLKSRLSEAINNLEEKKNQSTDDVNKFFFVSKDVARILLANIYMYEGNWSDAKPLLAKVKSNGYYTLDKSDDNDKSGNGVIFTLLNETQTRSTITITKPSVVPLQTITDVYLSLAECEYHLGNTSEGDRLLSSVKSAKGITTSKNGINGIWEARNKLLIYSAGNFAFLKRNGLAKTECGLSNDNYLLFPIPQNEVSLNSSMIQNPGY